VSDGIVARVVQVVGPLINVVRPGLDGLGPLARLAQIGDPLRSEHAQNLPLGYVCRSVDHHQIDEVVDVGQVLAVEAIDRDRTVRTR
jgi:hypothetical protein